MRLLKSFLIFTGFFFLVTSAFAGEVQLTPEVHGYLSLPPVQDQKSAPALILIHEWWGLNDHIKELADKFAEQGYAALAVDLYRGEVVNDPSVAHELMRGLPDDRALNDLKLGVTYLQNLQMVDKKNIGVIGWCMGGGFSLELGVRDPRIRAVVMYYGKLITDNERLKALHAPLLGIFGAQDRGITAKDVEDFKFRLNQLDKRAEIYSYPEAGHAFANPSNPGYRKDDAHDAWTKTLIFLKANLVSE